MEEENGAGIPKIIRVDIIPPSTKPKPPGSQGTVENKTSKTQTTKTKVIGTGKLIAKKIK